MFALVDCNSCYASCEQIFRPDLRGRPVIVLSNNDGCIVARSREAKSLGIPDLEPYFKLEGLLRERGVHVFSSNYALYGDISNRVMMTLRAFSPAVEVYSIDEMFLDFDGLTVDLKQYGHQIKNTIWRDIRMSVGVGIAPTKTLAKLANRAAKKISQTDGVCVLDTPEKWQWLHRRLPVTAVWGIGSRIGKRLMALNIRTIADLAKANPKYLRKHFSVNVERTVRELNGEPCLALEFEPPPKQQIYCTRSFGSRVYGLLELQQAVCLYAGRVAEKLRAQQGLAHTLHVFVHTSRHDENFYYNSTTVKAPYPTSDSRVLEQCVKRAVKTLYRPGFAYAKAGVGIIELSDRKNKQGDLFAPGQSSASESLMDCMDRINKKYGRSTVHIAGEGLHRRWAMRQNLLSPCYTTRWSDIPTVRC